MLGPRMQAQDSPIEIMSPYPPQNLQQQPWPSKSSQPSPESPYQPPMSQLLTRQTSPTSAQPSEEDLSRATPVEEPFSEHMQLTTRPPYLQASTRPQLQLDHDDAGSTSLPSAHQQQVGPANGSAQVSETKANDGELGVPANTTRQAANEYHKSSADGGDLDSGAGHGGSGEVSSTTKTWVTGDDVKESLTTTQGPRLEGRFRLRKKVKIVPVTSKTSKSQTTSSTDSPVTEGPDKPLDKTNNNQTHTRTQDEMKANE